MQLTQPASQVFARALEQARARGHDSVLPEDQLLALLAMQDSAAAGVLAQLGISGEIVSSKIAERLPATAAAATDKPLPYSQQAKEVLGWASYASLSLDSHHIGTEHLLLGIVRVSERGGSDLLDDLGLDPEELRLAVEKRAAAGAPSEPLPVQGPPARGLVTNARKLIGRHTAAKDRGARVSTRKVPTKRCKSAPALARALGSAVLEPAWWPEHASEINYRLIRWHRGAGYSITATGHGGAPVGINVHPEPPRAEHPERPEAGLALGDWHAPSELEGMRGLIGWVGFPRQLEAVVHADGMRVHLSGYESEADIVRVARSLQRRPAG